MKSPSDRDAIGTENNVGHDELEGAKRLDPPRDRKTDPDLEKPLTRADVVKIVDDALDARLLSMKKHVDDLHRFIMGSLAPDGTKLPGVNDTLAETNAHLAAIRTTSRATYELVKDLGDEIFVMHQRYSELAAKVGTLEAEVTLLGQDSMDPNGSTHNGDSK